LAIVKAAIILGDVLLNDAVVLEAGLHQFALPSDETSVAFNCVASRVELLHEIHQGDPCLAHQVFSLRNRDLITRYLFLDGVKESNFSHQVLPALVAAIDFIAIVVRTPEVVGVPV
jgi:hypothetical protein